MAVYRVQAPDGSILKIEGPDDARPEEIEAFAAQQFGGGGARAQRPPAQPERASPTDGMSFGEQVAAGGGKALYDAWRGLRQIGANFGIGDKEAIQAEIDEAKRADAPLMDTAGGLVGNIAGNVGMALAPGAGATTAAMLMHRLSLLGKYAPLMARAGQAITAPNTVRGAAAVGAGFGAAQPVASDESRFENMAGGAAGGAAGVAAGKAIGAVASRVGRPVQTTITETQRAANEAADRLGVTLSAGEQTGSRALKWAESALGDMPFAAGREQARVLANDKALARAALKSIGQEGDEILPQSLAAARQAIGGTFRKILDPLEVTLDDAFVKDVTDITGSKVMKELRDEGVDELIAPFKNLPAGRVKVDGDWFQQNKTALDNAIRAAYNNGQPGKAMALEAFEDALDGAARRSMGKEAADAYEAARRQWANLRILETGQVVKDGRVMPGSLNQALSTRYKAAHKEGALTGELPDIASLSSTLRGPPQSGTTPRAIYSGLAGGAAFAEPVSGLAMLGSPVAIQSLMQSGPGRAYLARGLYDLPPEVTNAIGRVGGLAGLGLSLAPR